MIKKITNFLFRTSYAEKMVVLKDVFFTTENENMARVIRLIKKSGIKQNPNAIIMDVGAFDGSTANLLSKAFPSTKVMAFEANPEVYQTAVKNCSGNKNITLHNCAASDKTETVTFYVTANNVSSSLNPINNDKVNAADYKSELSIKKEVSIGAKRLDEFTADAEIILLKIDTQGHELQVLEGAKTTLAKTTFVLVEMSNHSMYVNGCKYYEVDEWMRKNNFSLADVIVTYRKQGIIMSEYDAIYVNNKNKLF